MAKKKKVLTSAEKRRAIEKGFTGRTEAQQKKIDKEREAKKKKAKSKKK